MTQPAAAPEQIVTARLLLRKPVAADAPHIFARYSSDPEVTRYLAWATHASLVQTNAFLSFSDAEWRRWPAGPFLIYSQSDGKLLGGTGLAFESPEVAATGYVFARDAWGFGYATEALAAMVDLAERVGVRRLFALCHPDNAASIRVLKKGGFQCESVTDKPNSFPNLDGGVRRVALCFVVELPRIRE